MEFMLQSNIYVYTQLVLHKLIKSLNEAFSKIFVKLKLVI